MNNQESEWKQVLNRGKTRTKNKAVTQKEHEAANHSVKENVRREEKNNIDDLAQQAEDAARKKITIEPQRSSTA